VWVEFQSLGHRFGNVHIIGIISVVSFFSKRTKASKKHRNEEEEAMTTRKKERDMRRGGRGKLSRFYYSAIIAPRRGEKRAQKKGKQ
jgi:hypothetical protein